MTIYRIAVLAAITVLMAIPVSAQTTGELLQKGIYTQDTAGDFDGAIAIYRQIVGSGNAPRDIAAQAQYRLAQSLIEKGDLANGATEFSNLARNYADYGKLISSLAVQARAGAKSASQSDVDRGTIRRMMAAQVQLEMLKAEMDRLKASGDSGTLSPQTQIELDRAMQQMANYEARLAELRAVERTFQTAGRRDLDFDSNRPVQVQGKIFKMEFLNGQSSFTIDPGDGSGRRYTFVVTRADGIGKVLEQIRKGGTFSVTGFLAKDGRILPDGTIAAVASTIADAKGGVIYDRARMSK